MVYLIDYGGTMGFLLNAQLEELLAALHSAELLDKSRIKPNYFIRERKLPFAKLVMFMLDRSNASTQVALNRFTKLLGDDAVSQQAFSKARNKINHIPFLELFKASHKGVPRTKRWNGYLLNSLDGSIISLPLSKELATYFGTAGPKTANSPAARAGIRVDVLNGLVLDADITPSKIGERITATRFLHNQSGDDKEINIYDRGYFSWKFAKAHKEKGIHFLFRLKTKFNNEIDDLPIGNHNIVTINGLKVRIIKLVLESGEIETLVTDLFDEDLDVQDFKELYALRWGVETKYDLVKNKLALENFTGLSPNAIKQDFFSSMTILNLVAIVKIEADAEISENREGKNNKYKYVANVNTIVGTLKDYLILAFLHSGTPEVYDIMDEIRRVCSRSVVPVRPGRSFPRSNTRNVKFHINCKSNL